MQEFTVDHYIEKFSKIPDELWNDDGQYVNSNNCDRMCALGHCGYRDANNPTSSEAFQLSMMFLVYLNINVPFVNDGAGSAIIAIFGKTPKERILNALSMIKTKQNNGLKL